MVGSVDLVLICGRRPSLLAQTLASFWQKVFPHFQLTNFIANIDPFMGDKAAGDDCADLLRAAFPPDRGQQHLLRPKETGFAAAVQRAWRATRSDFVFHLKDDRAAHEDITAQSFIDLMQPKDVQAVTRYSRLPTYHHGAEPPPQLWRP